MRTAMEPAQDIYASYAPFYDAINGSRSSRIGRIQQLIDRHAPGAQDILELACGTGVIAAGLRQGYRLVGLDISPAMLRIARAKRPHITFVQGDMTTFKLDDQFDIIFCTHNSVEHLLQFEAWQRMFERVAQHLRPGGIFIFDTNTSERMQVLAAADTWSVDLSPDSCALIDVGQAQEGQTSWRVQIFDRPPGVPSYRVQTTTITTRIFPHDMIEQALLRHFVLLEATTGPGNPLLDQEAGRACYVYTRPTGQQNSLSSVKMTT